MDALSLAAEFHIFAHLIAQRAGLRHRLNQHVRVGIIRGGDGDVTQAEEPEGERLDQDVILHTIKFHFIRLAESTPWLMRKRSVVT